MDKLKLIAFDAEDLAVVSAHVQDAVLKVGDMVFQPKERRFVALVRRYDWAASSAAPGRTGLRRQAALRFERVRAARHQGIERGAPGTVLALLALQYIRNGDDDPAGTVTLTFAGGGAVQLDVECVEVELSDLGPVWRARSRPAHPERADVATPGKPAKR